MLRPIAEAALATAPVSVITLAIGVMVERCANRGRLPTPFDFKHRDGNVAALVPILDVIFGAYRPGRTAETPPTGVALRTESRSIGGALIWPYPSPLSGIAVGGPDIRGAA